MKCIRLVGWWLVFFSFVLTTACSQGGGTSTPQIVSGVAASGAPINGTVVLKDSKGTLLGPVNTDDGGNFQFDVTRLTPPFILKAAGVSGTQNCTLYSVAMGAGNAHINPFSNLTLQLATGVDPATVFELGGGTIDETELKTALRQSKNLLAPILNQYGITDFDPITGAYSATPDNRIDALLDVVGLKVENGLLTITNKFDDSVILTGNLTNMTNIYLDLASLYKLTDIKDIADRLAALTLTINKGGSFTVQDLNSFFIPDPNYGTSNGQTRAQDITSIVTIFGPNGTNTYGKLKSIRNVRLVSDQTVNYTGRSITTVYLLNYDFIYENGKVVNGNNTTWAKDVTTAVWKFIGDPAGASIGNNNGLIDQTQNIQNIEVDSDFATGTTGSIIDGQSFNETRAVGVTLLGNINRVTETITLKGLNIRGDSSALIGVRIYDTSTKALIASNNAAINPGINLSVTIPLSTTLVAGKTYTIGFYVQTTPSWGGSGSFYLPNTFLNINNQIAYYETSGIFKINSALSVASDSYPEYSNQAVPQITIKTVVP